MLDGVKPEANPNVRWLLLVAHDTNIAMVRTLMNFSWQLPGYSRGNIPPGSSLVLERWRNAKSGERYLRVYFQAQGLDDLRRLQTPDAQHPMLRQGGVSRAAVRPTLVRCVPSRRPSPRWVSVSTGHPPRR